LAGNPITRAFGRLTGGKVTPTKTVGAMGSAIYGGYVQSVEDSADLAGERKFKTYSEIMANVSIAAAGVRYFLAVMGKASWTFTPSEADVDGKYAEMAEQIIMDDPATPWHRIVKRAGMYRFFGFSVQEWTARRREDGVMTFLDVAPRAQKTIERWDIDPVNGEVRGVWQRIPQSGREVYLPRGKIMYVVDDSLSDSPEGLGLFRHIVKTSKALQVLERLEGLGFETDLRGIPSPPWRRWRRPARSAAPSACKSRRRSATSSRTTFAMRRPACCSTPRRTGTCPTPRARPPRRSGRSSC
jgi:hypothetical protein